MRWILFLLLILPVPFYGQEKNPISNEMLGNAVFCLQQKLTSIGYAPPKFSEHEYRLKYLFGVQNAGDQPDELQLIVYAPFDKKGILYQLYLEKNRHPIFYIGEMGTLKRSGGDMVSDEIWGGTGTYYQVKRLLRKFSSQNAIVLRDADVKKGTGRCVLQR